jgi:hypothetical protein
MLHIAPEFAGTFLYMWAAVGLHKQLFHVASCSEIARYIFIVQKHRNAKRTNKVTDSPIVVFIKTQFCEVITKD